MVNAGGIGCSIATIEVLPGVLRSLLVDKSSLRIHFDTRFMTDFDTRNSYDPPDYLLLPCRPRARQAGVPWPEHVSSVSHTGRSHNCPLESRI